MAAETRWVRPTSGSDAADGLTFATAWLTMSKVCGYITATLVDGDVITIYVTNESALTMDATAAAVTIDGHPSSTITVSGVLDDATATPALTSVIAPATGDARFMFVRSVGSFFIEGFDVNFNASVASGTVQKFIETRDTDGGPYEVRYCRVRGSTTTTAPASARHIVFAQSGIYPIDWARVHHCVIENMTQPTLSVSGAASLASQFYFNVLVWDALTAYSSAMTVANTASASNDIRVYNNTVYINVVNSASGVIGGWLDHNASSGGQGRVDFYNNLMWFETDSAAATKITNFVAGGSGGTFDSGTISNNIFYAGPTTDAGEVTASYQGVPWVPAYTGDVAAYSQANTVLFNDPSSTYSWVDVNSSGYTLTVPKDLRPIAEFASGIGGSVPGALEASGSDLGVTLTSDAVIPRELSNITFTLGVVNNGPLASTGVTCTLTVPSGFTYKSKSAGTGAYDELTGIWTVANLANGASTSRTVTYTVDTGTKNVSKTFTLAVTTSDTADIVAANDTASVILLVSVGNQSGDTATATASEVEGIYDYYYNNDGGKARQVLICASNNIYIDAGDHRLRAVYYTLPTNGSQYTFTPMNNVCVICSDNDDQRPLQYSSNGKTVRRLRGKAPNIGFAVEHFSRIVGAGDPQFDSILFSSKVLDPDSWEPGGNDDDPITLGITVDDGQRITGLSAAHYGRLYVFKEGSISSINGSWSSATDISRSTISKTRGCISHHTIQPVGNDILFWSDQGCHSILSTDKFGDVESKDISFPVREAFRRRVDTLQLDKAFSVNYTDEDMYLTWFKEKGVTDVKLVFVYHYGIDQWSIWQYKALCAASVIGDSSRKKIWTGAPSGKIFEWPGNQYHTTVDIGTGGLVGGDAREIKNYEEFQLHTVPWGDAEASVTLQFGGTEGVPHASQTQNISLMPKTGTVLGDFILDESTMTDKDEVLVSEVDFDGGPGRTARITIEQDTSNVGLEVLGYIVRATTKGT